MTVATVPTTPELAWLDAAEAALDGPDDPAREPVDFSRDVLTRINRLEARLAARKLARIRRIDEAELAKRSGATSTSSMLANDSGGDQAACSRQVRTAQNLKVATLTEKALEAGEITLSQMLHEWALHDLGHIRQIAELVRARKYLGGAGPLGSGYHLKP